MKYAALGLALMFLTGCVSGPHSGADCDAGASTRAHFGVFGIADALHCYSTASDSATAVEESEPFPPTKLDPVVEDPRPPQNSAEPGMLTRPVMVNPSSDTDIGQVEAVNNSPQSRQGWNQCGGANPPLDCFASEDGEAKVRELCEQGVTSYCKLSND